MTPLRAFAALLLALALGAGGFAVWSYRSMAERVTQLEATAKDYAALKESFASLQAEVGRRQQYDTTIRANRASTNKAIQEAARADTATADFITTPLPDGLRGAYLKAREQRVALPDNH